MHYTQLKNFLEIVECGSINKASQKLFMSQSTLSQQIKQLEEEVGIELFDRNGNRITLTPQGVMLAEYAQRSIVEHEKIIKQLQESKYGIKHALIIGLAQNSLTVDTGSWVSETALNYPDISFNIVYYRFEALLEMMARGEVDVCLTKQLIRDADFLNNYEIKLLKTNKVVVVAPAEMDFGNKKTLKLKDLDGKNVVLRTKHEQRFLDKCAKQDSYPIVRATTRSNALKFELVKHRVGLGFFVEDFENMQGPDAEKVKVYDIDGIGMENKTYVVYPKSRKDFPAVKAFLEVIFKATGITLEKD